MNLKRARPVNFKRRCFFLRNRYMAKKIDKRVFDMRIAVIDDPTVWRLLAVSSDALLPEFYRTVQGAFEWVSPMWAKMLVEPDQTFGMRKGSRTPLHRIFSVGSSGMLALADNEQSIALKFEVLRAYEVQSRRHHPKVLDGAKMYRPSFDIKFDRQSSTWRAQDFSRYGVMDPDEYFARASAGEMMSQGLHEDVMDMQRRLSRRERDKLEALMNVRDPSGSGHLKGSLTFLHGFLTSIISGPIILPSEWLPIYFSDANEEGIGLVMRFYNEIASDLASGRFAMMVDRIEETSGAVDRAENWCRGYLRALAIRPGEWAEAAKDKQLHTYLLPIVGLGDAERESGFDPVADPEVYGELLNALPECAFAIYQWWRERLVEAAPPSPSTIRRSEPKISPNVPCPCGSGKKYKRCCSPLRVV